MQTSPDEDQCFDGRIAELVLLNSMYPGQLELDDAQLQDSIRSEDVTAKCAQSVSGLFLVDKSLEVHFVLPIGYPENEKPTIHCRIMDGRLGRDFQKQFNDDIAQFMDKGDSNLIETLQTILHMWDDRRVEAFKVLDNTDQVDARGNDGKYYLLSIWLN